jgi:RimJ/RimL family protein N-acetyltransferase
MNSSKKKLSLHRFQKTTETGDLVRWLASDRWPFHSSPTPSCEDVEERIRGGEFSGSETETFWLVDGPTEERVGLLSIQEISDLTPVFDLRLRTPWRGLGLGGQALELLSSYVFERLAKSRVEGHTRVDNVAMRRTFLKQGWVKEAHYRQCWPGEDGRLFDAVTYSLLRSDQEAGTLTPVPWNDEPESRRPKSPISILSFPVAESLPRLDAESQEEPWC